MIRQKSKFKVIEKLRLQTAARDDKVKSLEVSYWYDFKKTKLVGVRSLYRMGP